MFILFYSSIQIKAFSHRVSGANVVPYLVGNLNGQLFDVYKTLLLCRMNKTGGNHLLVSSTEATHPNKKKQIQKQKQNQDSKNKFQLRMIKKRLTLQSVFAQQAFGVRRKEEWRGCRFLLADLYSASWSREMFVEYVTTRHLSRVQTLPAWLHSMTLHFPYHASRIPLFNILALVELCDIKQYRMWRWGQQEIPEHYFWWHFKSQLPRQHRHPCLTSLLLWYAKAVLAFIM